MAIELYFGPERAALRRAGRIAAETLRATCAQVKAGVTTETVDRFVRADTEARGAARG